MLIVASAKKGCSHTHSFEDLAPKSNSCALTTRPSLNWYRKQNIAARYNRNYTSGGIQDKKRNCVVRTLRNLLKNICYKDCTVITYVIFPAGMMQHSVCMLDYDNKQLMCGQKIEVTGSVNFR